MSLQRTLLALIVLAVLAIIQYVTNPDDLRPVIIVCVMVAISVGLQFWQEYRSALAADNLQKMGYKNCISMDGGWRSWTEAGFPTEKGK